jgi:hypothetical protein
MPFYSAIRQEHWLRDKRDAGASVVLEDESLWEIDPSDRSKTARWLRGYGGADSKRALFLCPQEHDGE